MSKKEQNYLQMVGMPTSKPPTIATEPKGVGKQGRRANGGTMSFKFLHKRRKANKMARKSRQINRNKNK